ncbi:MAG: sugar phosphate nucleotidyltransferase [Planctomycetota bacterium]|nr:sugar phosphate nucleotidyltransferase [Planctomycetota bacterium]
MSNTIGIVLAGGVGTRLGPLTADRAKPAVPFGGQYRIIDFTLANCVNSGLRKVLVLTQYKSQSLLTHLRNAWDIVNPHCDDYITAVPSQMRTGDSWYCGTADAVCQNVYLLKRSGAKSVLILSGDHVYQMDYSNILRQHESTSADVTVACTNVSLSEARWFGVLALDATDRITEFQEKPASPRTIPGSPDRALGSMGVYVFSVTTLCDALIADHEDLASDHDFGKDIIPRTICNHAVYGYQFGKNAIDSPDPYWRDVGTIDKGVSVPPGVRVRPDSEHHHQNLTVSETGVVVIPKGHQFCQDSCCKASTHDYEAALSAMSKKSAFADHQLLNGRRSLR